MLEAYAKTQAPELSVPHNAEAEQGLLGAVLVNNKAYGKVADFLKAEHFYDPLHARIFEAVDTLVKRDRVADPVTLKAFFADDPDIIGGGYLEGLQANVVAVINAEHYGRIVYDCWLRRQLMEAAMDMLADAQTEDPQRTAEQRVEAAEARLYELSERRADSKKTVSLTDALARADEIIAQAQSATDGITGVPTGLIDVDARYGGFQASGLYVLAGRPSMGKTALSLTMAMNAARAGYPVLFFSMEMSAEELAMRVYAQSTGISVKEQRRLLSPDQLQALARARKELSGLPLEIEEGAALTLPQIRAKSRRHQRRHGLDLVVIDYLGLAKPTDSRLQKVHQIEEITGGLKQMAKELRVPVLLLAQLSRAVELRDDKRPMLSDLRDSGSIEQDADGVMFVYREEYYLEREQPQAGGSKDKWAEKMAEWSDRMSACRNVAEIITAKLRQSEIGVDRVHFDGPRQLFTDLARGR